MTDIVKALLVAAVLILPLAIGWDLIEFGDFASTDGLLIGVAVGVTSLLARIGWIEWKYRRTGIAPEPRSATWIRVAVIGLAGPVLEELLYRGLLQPQLGLLIAASFFAIGHTVATTGPITTGPLSGFLGGLLLGLIARDYGLVPAMVAHAGINLSALFVSAVYLRKFPAPEIGDELIAELAKIGHDAGVDGGARRDTPGWWFVRGLRGTDQPDTCEVSQWFAVYVAEWQNALPSVVQDYDGTREPVQKLIDELEADYLEWSGPIREPPEDREADLGRLN